MRILSVSNFIRQFTGYATCQRHFLPRLQEQTGNEFIHLAVSGISNARPFEYDDTGVKVYPSSSTSGKLSVGDISTLCQKENIDLVWTQFDMWAVSGNAQQVMDRPDTPPFVVYAPIDHHDPMGGPAPNWNPILKRAAMNVPYCEFGKKRMEEVDSVDEDRIWNPIYHGIDPDDFYPRDTTPSECMKRMPDDTFVIGFVKNNQGTRAAHERALHAFRLFLDREDAWDNALMYMHCAIHGSESPQLDHWIAKLGLEDNVLFPADEEYKWGIGHDLLAQRYSAMDVLLNNVRGEGFGMPILEAMACGTSVITGAYSAMGELVGLGPTEVKWDGGDTTVLDAPRGWAVPTNHEEFTLGKQSYRRDYRVEHITDAIVEAYNNPDTREQKGERAAEWASQHTWQSKANQFAELFDYLEDELWQTDEDTGVTWEKIDENQARGGVGAFGGRWKTAEERIREETNE